MSHSLSDRQRRRREHDYAFEERRRTEEALRKEIAFAGRIVNLWNAKKFAEAVLANPPTGWQTSGDVSTWSRRWADEIMPLAREAHEGIVVHVPGKDQDASHDEVECRWNTDLTPGYDEWAAQPVREQLAKAGFRLAAMLQVLLQD